MPTFVKNEVSDYRQACTIRLFVYELVIILLKLKRFKDLKKRCEIYIKKKLALCKRSNPFIKIWQYTKLSSLEEHFKLTYIMFI